MRRRICENSSEALNAAALVVARWRSIRPVLVFGTGIGGCCFHVTFLLELVDAVVFTVLFLNMVLVLSGVDEVEVLVGEVWLNVG